MTQSKRKKTDLAKVLHLAQQLPPEDQDTLVKILNRQNSNSLMTGKEFLESKTDLDALRAANPQVKPFKVGDMQLDDWDDEDFNKFLAWRKEERERL